MDCSGGCSLGLDRGSASRLSCSAAFHSNQRYFYEPYITPRTKIAQSRPMFFFGLRAVRETIRRVRHFGSLLRSRGNVAREKGTPRQKTPATRNLTRPFARLSGDDPPGFRNPRTWRKALLFFFFLIPVRSGDSESASWCRGLLEGREGSMGVAGLL
ncbi:hypothetical protein B296_00034295 [Ensete ventricosum]|uniref:Uncharacterized protein n=1 Tax=Ensete ventricosum TaxID=4639 RepID=A0A426ZSS9_ENSVE|nr:hypothetical protein B296_00034295 [Ensete ventricosum]